MQPVPVTFYLDVDDKDIASWRALRPDAEPQRLVLGEDYWITQTYARLRDAGDAVQLDNHVPESGIVLFYAGDKRAVWRAAQRGSRALLVGVRSDRHPVGFAIGVLMPPAHTMTSVLAPTLDTTPPRRSSTPVAVVPLNVIRSTCALTSRVTFLRASAVYR